MSRRPSAEKVPCPDCGQGISRVLDTRGAYRLRVCGQCGTRFVTAEGVLRRVPASDKRLHTPKKTYLLR